MTKQEAERLLHANDELYWVIEHWHDNAIAKLDGRFSMQEIEAVVTLMRPSVELPTEPQWPLLINSRIVDWSGCGWTEAYCREHPAEASYEIDRLGKRVLQFCEERRQRRSGNS